LKLLDYGFYNKGNPTIDLLNSRFENNIIYNSILYIKDNIFSKFSIGNTEFISNIGKQGVILQNMSSKKIYTGSFKNCIFKNNKAMGNGGILFSITSLKTTTFDNCKFINNTAEAGNRIKIYY